MSGLKLLRPPAVDAVESLTTLDAVTALAAVDQLLKFARARVVKAASLTTTRDKTIADVLPKLQDDLAAYFAAMARRLTSRISKAVEQLWDIDDFDWGDEEDELGEIVHRWSASIGVAGYDAAAEQLVIDQRWDTEAPSIRALRDKVASRVKGITEASRESVRSMIETATERGYSIDELVDGKGSSFAGLADLVSGWGSDAGRAGVIARTETAIAWNESTNASYRDSGLVDSVEVLDGSECGWTEHDDPDLADGSIRTLDEADEYPTSHPNCQRAFAAVVAR